MEFFLLVLVWILPLIYQKQKGMKFITELQSGGKIRMSESTIDDNYFIEQADDQKFYITSERGYNGYEGEGFADLEKAIKRVRQFIKDDVLENKLKGL